MNSYLLFTFAFGILGMCNLAIVLYEIKSTNFIVTSLKIFSQVGIILFIAFYYYLLYRDSIEPFKKQKKLTKLDHKK